MQAIIKKRPSRNINVQNFWLYIFGVLFNLVAICVQDYDAVMNKLVAIETIRFYGVYIIIHGVNSLTSLCYLMQRLFPWILIHHSSDDS